MLGIQDRTVLQHHLESAHNELAKAYMLIREEPRTEASMAIAAAYLNTKEALDEIRKDS